MIKKIIISVFCLSLIFVASEWFRRNVGGFAGSYPFAESWKINKSIAEIEGNLKLLQQKSPDVFLDKEEFKLANDATGFWKIVNFYYPEREEIVKVLFRGFDNYSQVLLVSFQNISTGEIRLMNKDFNWFENRKEKKIFESRIVESL